MLKPSWSEDLPLKFVAESSISQRWAPGGEFYFVQSVQAPKSCKIRWWEGMLLTGYVIAYWLGFQLLKQGCFSINGRVVWSVVCGVWRVVCGMCISVQCAVCSAQCAVFIVQRAKTKCDPSLFMSKMPLMSWISITHTPKMAEWAIAFSEWR